MSQPPRRPTADNAPSEGEWTFRRDGQLFGPVPEARLRELLFEGQVDAETDVSCDGGPYRQLGQVSRFLVDLKKAEAHIRVEREITDSRRIDARRRRLRGIAVVGGAAAVLAVGLGGAIWLASARPWQKRSELLEAFGDGIAISVPARIGAARARPAEPAEEVLVPSEPGAPPRAARQARERSVAPAAPAPERPAQGDLVLAQWDEANIQAVVGKEQRTLAPCLRAEAARSPDYRGEIPVEFAIGNDGKVVSLWIDEPRFRRGPLHECLLEALQRWRFKPFPGQQPVIALAFRVGGA
ncbi:MAG: AgmX/PglI C-terminal domain-containing protein [Deltaproteobacteria bacterium]|nr:AgmX/PglI C-terminal domain-containing protein [Deltaproteobacteria bacterium]